MAAKPLTGANAILAATSDSVRDVSLLRRGIEAAFRGSA